LGVSELSATDFAVLMGVSKVRITQAINRGQLVKSIRREGSRVFVDIGIGAQEWIENVDVARMAGVEKEETVTFANRRPALVDVSKLADRFDSEERPKLDDAGNPILYDGSGNVVPSSMHSRRMRDHYDALAAERENRIAEGRFVDIEEIAREMSLQLSTVRARVIEIASKMAPQLVGRTVSEIEKMLYAECAQALLELTLDESLAVNAPDES
jgi:hypothetical protein